MKLSPVYDPKSLSSSKVYRIDGAFYQYLRQSGSSAHPQYVFGYLPAPGHKTKSDLLLNRNKLISRCEEVVGMACNTTEAKESSEQLQLF
ncbi:hypothetical protein [Halotia branconii]|uniref:Uncharacterized protein n=1 Tax=Halotia branconii CENA392 TaxID=1539056 RepID=A0AAJ6NYU5_9CYAN|nr:hypothetical protein [Halotia branconii]WGV29147.1 hypothetical protein QI031_30555 [Halotia branconii CENA392]